MGGDNSSIVPAGLPNILGEIGGITLVTGDNEAKGAFRVISEDNEGWNVDANHREIIGFNARWSNAIYGNSDTVQPPSYALIPQIRF